MLKISCINTFHEQMANGEKAPDTQLQILT
jgi:hypothetical protein